MGRDEDTHSEEEEVNTLANGAVVEKYKMAGGFVNVALKAVVEAAKPGASPFDLCNLGDKLILEQTEKVFNKKGAEKIEKGIAFPMCINVNRVAAHFSPCEDDKVEPLVAGDIVKIDLGCHIDGFAAVAAHTVVVADDLAAEVPASPQSNVVAAAAAAVDALTHCFRPEFKNSDITDLISKIAKDYDVTPVEGVLSHNLNQYIIDGCDVVTSKVAPDQHVMDVALEENQVWALDIVFSSAPFDSKDGGKLKQLDQRTNVFKRSLDQYQLKMKASREVFADIERKFQTFPFAMRHLDAKKGRFCISECLKHELVNPYPVLVSKADETTAHFKTTILIRSSEIEKVTGLPAQKIATDKKIQDEDVLREAARSLTLKKKNKKKKKKAAAPAAEQ
eukprot:Rhum_TRINITY_DN14309_c16_g1::Rhum_TRINITY_DN14309_c16_g1_i1::g.81027::m.81027